MNVSEGAAQEIHPGYKHVPDGEGVSWNVWKSAKSWNNQAQVPKAQKEGASGSGLRKSIHGNLV